MPHSFTVLLLSSDRGINDGGDVFDFFINVVVGGLGLKVIGCGHIDRVFLEKKNRSGQIRDLLAAL